MSIWICRRCGNISHIEEITARQDGYCKWHPAGAGSHSFALYEAEKKPIYERVSELKVLMQARNDLAGNGTPKVGVKINTYIEEVQLFNYAVRLAMSLQEIHRIASAGSPLGEPEDDLLSAISELAADGYKEKP